MTYEVGNFCALSNQKPRKCIDGCKGRTVTPKVDLSVQFEGWSHAETIKVVPLKVWAFPIDFRLHLY